MKFVRRALSLMIIIVLLFWGFAVLKCEILTASHAREFEDEYIQEDIVVPSDSIKILFYSDEYARVYYEYGHSADIIDFRQTEGKWRLGRRVSVKSENDLRPKKIVWPYIWYYLI